MAIKKIVLFDVDNVLVRGQTQKLLLTFLFKRGKINWLFFIKIYFWFLLYKFNLNKNIVKIREEAFNIMNGWSKVETEEIFKEFFDQEIKPRIFHQAVDLVHFYHNKNYEIILVSASLSEIVNKLKDYLSLRFAIATKLEVMNDRYTGKTTGLVPYGEDKIKAVRELLDTYGFSLEESYAYADHFSDLPLLEIVKTPTVVNPDKKLRRIAKKKEMGYL